MITSLTFIRNQYPPVPFESLKPGDWFVPDETTHGDIWVKGMYAGWAWRLRDGVEVHLSPQPVWRVQAPLFVTGRPPDPAV